MIDLSKMTDADAERFRSKLIKGRLRGSCHHWGGSHKAKGYARFGFQGHTVAAHRVAYYLAHGAFDWHLEIDHLCRTLDCVNPKHLEAVCPLVNRQRRIEHHANSNH